MPRLLFAQQEEVLHYVNPFIGTAKSDVYTRWGNEGGTYPGAVAPWGYIQLTPETRNSGYDYKDSSIRFFSCLQHRSGFPGGSGGRLHIMPVAGKYDSDYKRPVLHTNEYAEPGYYSVTLEDDKTKIEATTTTHAGLFKITFPPHVMPAIWVGDAGDMSILSPNNVTGRRFNTLLHFDKAISDTQKVADGYILHFSPAAIGNTIITIQLSASAISIESSQQNIDAELADKSFNEVKENTGQSWNKLLSVIRITDTSKENKEIFYTALYHSLLLPWITSDVNGKYRGADGQIHTAKGKHAYGGFSPWDTFRSLHPLLSLLYPDRQSDMILSMLDIYKQKGYLPIESMTGNHSIPILVDSYLKGIRPVDSVLLYRAMKKSIVDGPYLQPDMSLYQQGFIPYPHTESVTRTVEYTYDDWALAQYAKAIMHDDSLYAILTNRSRNYRYLFNADELSLLPRKGDALYHGTANAGYKEGDQWVYTLFIPHYQRDLINLLGGDDNFIQMIDKAFENNRLVFDNETMFHVPYLFNSTAYPYKTQQWVHAIEQRFAATPGGLPGNDDLGATSSWFVWSALGLYPVCPGNPVYALGAPLFKDVEVILPNGKHLDIHANNISPDNFYVKSIHLNGKAYNDTWLTHATILKGGELTFTMDSVADKMQRKGAIPGEQDSDMQTYLSAISLSQKSVKPNEPFWITFTINNTGAAGTAIVKLRINDSTFLQKNCFVEKQENKRDSILCRLYAYGNNKLQLADLSPLFIQVTKPEHQTIDNSFISNVQVSPLTKKGSKMYYRYTVKNMDGEAHQFVIPVKLNDKLLRYDTVMLHAGDSVVINHHAIAREDGGYQLTIKDAVAKGKVYSTADSAIVLDIPGEIMGKEMVTDVSGFENNGHKAAFGNYIELPHTASLDSNGTALTMIAWIYDAGTNKPLVELIAKGDNHVLQLVNGKSLTFFAGGWGRGDCTVQLPEDWQGRWHQIAGVCNSADLRVYIDGKLQGITPLEEEINLDVAAKWTIGSNEEFPLDRTFTGQMRDVKIYIAPLSVADIQSIYQKEKVYP
ncbi:GH92 family glycosyl hydrolase [Ilyomonas limi]|nr:GH92 family glycosyl hydrolase [Ilyomonas limi]